MKRFDKNKAHKKIEFSKNKHTYIKRLSVSFSCLLLIMIIMLFSLAKYEVSSDNYTLINGKVKYNRVPAAFEVGYSSSYTSNNNVQDALDELYGIFED